MPRNRASLCILSLNFTSLLALIRILLFPCLKLFLPLVTGIEFLNFRHKESGKGINDGLWQFDLVWILTFFLAGHSVLPQQQNLSGSTQSISHSFRTIHSCQRLFPYTEGKQIILKSEKILIELLSHPFPSGGSPEKPAQNSSDRKGMNRIKLGIFIFFFLSFVWFSHFKKEDYRTCRIHYSDFRRSVTGFLEVGVRNRFIVF